MMNHDNHTDSRYADCADCYPNEPLVMFDALASGQVAGATRIYTYREPDYANPDDFDRPDTDI